jgi:hypothetical protein
MYVFYEFTFCGSCIFPNIQVSKKLMDDHDFFTSQRYGDNGTCQGHII